MRVAMLFGIFYLQLRIVRITGGNSRLQGTDGCRVGQLDATSRTSVVMPDSLPPQRLVVTLRCSCLEKRVGCSSIVPRGSLAFIEELVWSSRRCDRVFVFTQPRVCCVRHCRRNGLLRVIFYVLFGWVDYSTRLVKNLVVTNLRLKCTGIKDLQVRICAELEEEKMIRSWEVQGLSLIHI